MLLKLQLIMMEPRVGHDGINKKCPIVGDLIPMSFPGSKDVVDHTVENPTHQVHGYVAWLSWCHVVELSFILCNKLFLSW